MIQGTHLSCDCQEKSRLLSTLRSIRPCTTSLPWTSMVMRVMIFARDSLVNLPNDRYNGAGTGGRGTPKRWLSRDRRRAPNTQT